MTEPRVSSRETQLDCVRIGICTYLGSYDIENTEVTRTGVAYRRQIAASTITNNTALQCSMQFDQAVQPTATLPELTDSPVPPAYTYSWQSSPVLIIGDYHSR